MQSPRRGLVLVGHGGIPRDCPRELITRLKALEAGRRATSEPATAEEHELDRRIRRWPRTPETDPYQAGLDALAAHVKAALDDDTVFAVAYNEFCAPTVEEAVAAVIAAGATQISVVPSMLTPGGSHSEVEIPESLARLRARHPGVRIRYAWPFDLPTVAAMLVAHVRRFEVEPGSVDAIIGAIDTPHR
ncbi:sirohydrochlorin chelatase [Candidatus Nitrospira bockiana]